MAAPPRLAALLVRLSVRPESWKHDVVGDLCEEFAEVSATRTRRSAHAWYWRQALMLAGRSLLDRLRSAARIIAVLFFVGDRPMSSLLQEFRLSGRALARRPGVTIAIVLTLALGLGANAASFAMADALLLRPMTTPGADRLVMISENSDEDPYPRESVSPANAYEWAAASKTLKRVAIFEFWNVTIAGTTQPDRALGFRIGGELFEMLGRPPALGRWLTAADETPGQHRVVVLSDALWQQRYGADPTIVGRTVRIEREPFTVVGVAPKDVTFPMRADFWAPFQKDPDATTNRRAHYVTAIGQLADERTLNDAQAELNVIYARQRSSAPQDMAGRVMNVRSLDAGMMDVGVPNILALVQSAAIFVLLIGATNIANLLVARGWDRQRDTAVRLAIGASRVRIVRQFVTEGLLIGLVSVPVALGFSWLALRALRSSMPANIQRFVAGWNQIDVDGRLVGATILAALVTSALIALIPALQTTRPNLAGTLSEGGRAVSGARRQQRLRRALVVMQMSLALPLLVAAGLATIAATELSAGPQGYDPEGVMSMRTELPDAPTGGFTDGTVRRQYIERLVAEVSQVPGVTSAGAVNAMPSGDSSSSRTFFIEGQAAPDPNRPQPAASAPYRTITPGYFETLRIPVLRGRGISTADRFDGEPVMVISAAMAARYWPNQEPIGARVRFDETPHRWFKIVGISGDIIDDWFNRRNIPMMYVPVAQRPQFRVHVVARTNGDVDALAAPLRAALLRADPDQSAEIMTVRALVRDRTLGLRMVGTMMAVLGALALVLATIGVYSLMAYDVVQRRHEIGVRMALGATPGSVLRLATSSAWKLSVTGVAIGLVFAVLLARAMEAALFGAAAASPMLFVTIALTLTGTALAASVIPSRQAAKLDPAKTLRQQ